MRITFAILLVLLAGCGYPEVRVGARLKLGGIISYVADIDVAGEMVLGDSDSGPDTWGYL